MLAAACAVGVGCCFAAPIGGETSQAAKCDVSHGWNHFIERGGAVIRHHRFKEGNVVFQVFCSASR